MGDRVDHLAEEQPLAGHTREGYEPTRIIHYSRPRGRTADQRIGSYTGGIFMSTTNGRHRLRVAAVAAAAAVTTIGCTQPRTPPGPGGTTTTMPGHEHGGGGGGHGHIPDRLNHEPTEEQKAAAIDFIRRTRAAVKEQGLTLEKLKAMHYININDGVHWIKPEYARDEFEFDPNRIEAFAVVNGELRAAMYTMQKGKTMDDAPDIAGNWTQFHNHYLPYQSNDFNTDEYFKLGGPNWRTTAPMLHVWLVKHPCGPFAGTNRAEGSCLPEIEPDFT
jgi:hypothetical protein